MPNAAAAREYGWDDVIENDGPDYEPVPIGDYDFEVVDFERARFGGSDKLPPCNQAVLHIRVTGDGHATTIKHNLYLHSKTEGLICAFFTAIGQRQKGQKFQMNWGKVIGSKGRCKVGIKTLPPRNKEEQGLTVNEIKRFYEPTEQPQANFTQGAF